MSEQRYPPLFFNSFTRWCPGFMALHTYSQTWNVATVMQFPVANKAMYMPFKLPWPYPIKRLFVGCGFASGGNYDFGIYSSSGTKLVSTGSIAYTVSSNLAFANANILLAPGNYYFALAASSTSAAFLGISTMRGSRLERRDRRTRSSQEFFAQMQKGVI